MMIDLVPDMPEMLEEAKEWRPKTYEEHFRDSSFTHKDLAIAAYDNVLDADRAALEMTVERMNTIIALSVKMLDSALATGDMDRARELCSSASRNLQGMIDRCSGIINGVEGAAETAFAAMDESTPMLDVTPAKEGADDDEAIVMAQSAIDALFD